MSNTSQTPTAEQQESHLLVTPDESLSFGKSIFLGLQHLLAMDIYIVPFIIAGVLALSVTDSAFLIQATFIAAGIGTLIQSRFLMKLPVAQGPSYVPIAAIIGITMAGGGGLAGLGTAFGSILIGSIIITILGFTGILRRAINYFVPPLVGGTIIFVVGLSLMPIGLSENIYAVHGAGTIGQNIILASVSGIALILCVVFGIHFGKKATGSASVPLLLPSSLAVS